MNAYTDSLEQGRQQFGGEHPAMRPRTAAVATIARVRSWGGDRTAMVLDLVTDQTRMHIGGVVLSDRAGFRSRSSRYPRAASCDLRYPVGDPRRELSTTWAMRIAQMRSATSSGQWDGDKVLVVLFGTWPIIVGYIEHGRAEDGMAANQWMDGGDKSLPVDAPLGAPWVQASDELPCVHRPAWPGCAVDWDGALVTTRWRDEGLAQEVREVLVDGSVGATALTRFEQSRRRFQMRGPRIELASGSNTLTMIEGTGVLADVQKFDCKLDGEDALLVSTSKPTGMDAPTTFDAALVVINQMAVQIAELQQMVGTALTVLRVFAGGGVAAAAGAVDPGAKLIAAAMTTLSTALPPGVPSQQPPTEAQKGAMAAANVRVRTS